MENRFCKGCSSWKSLDEFISNKYKKFGKGYRCYICHKKYMKDHYNKNKKYYIDKASKRNKEYTLWFQEFKNTLKCINCGEDHPACLDFHHRDRNAKEITITTAVGKKWAKERLLKELEKCDVLCCKCHRILHYNERVGP